MNQGAFKMSDETGHAARVRFAEDMRRIRREADVSIDEVCAYTQISEALVTAFEEGALYDHESFNEVYLRSFVRAYAESIDISPDAALSGLEAALEGAYQHELADEHLLDSAPLDRPDADAPEPSGMDRADSPSTTSSPSEDSEDAAGEPGGPRSRGVTDLPRLVDSRRKQRGRRQSGGSQEDREEGAGGSDSDAAVRESGSGGPAPAEPGRQDSPGSAAPSGFPEGFPHASRLHEAGVERISDLQGMDDLEEIAGIGPAYAAEIREALDEVQEDPDASQPHERGPDGDPDAPSSSPSPRPSSGEQQSASSPAGGQPDVGLGSQALESAPQSSPSSGMGNAGPSAGGFPSRLWQGRWGHSTGLGLGVLAALLIGGLGIWYATSWESTPSPDDDASEQRVAVAPDTSTRASETASSTADTTSGGASSPSLGETISLVIRADSSVNRLLVQRDDDLRRPYWIDEGEVNAFPFTERVRIENELDDVSLYLEGVAYSFSADTSNQVSISREEVSAFLSTVDENATGAPTATDTIPVGPPPSGN